MLRGLCMGPQPERCIQRAISAYEKDADRQKLTEAFNQIVHVTNGYVVYEAKIDGSYGLEPVRQDSLCDLG